MEDAEQRRRLDSNSGGKVPMTADTKINVKQVFPHLVYQDPAKAIDWMVNVLGMEPWAVYKDQGKIVHAELKFGEVFVGLGPVQTEGIFKGPVTTEGPYTALDGVDALYERAKSHRADVVMDLTDTDYGSRNFALRDPEGRIWSFGTWIHSPEPHIE
jgi:uncharacterized glyoxalase superfamily protein PhnB